MDGVAAVSWGHDRIDLFWRGDDRALWHRSWNAGTWSADESLGGNLASAPAVTAWAVDQLEVFAVFPDGQAVGPLLGRQQLARLGDARRRAGHGRGSARGIELERRST